METCPPLLGERGYKDYLLITLNIYTAHIILFDSTISTILLGCIISTARMRALFLFAIMFTAWGCDGDLYFSICISVNINIYMYVFFPQISTFKMMY